MLFEPTTLAATASAIAEALEHYGCDADTVFRKAGLDPSIMRRSGARYPMSAMVRLWDAAVHETADPCFGLLAGQKIRPPSLHALGLSWLSSPTLLDGLQRLVRYARVVNTSMRLDLVRAGGREKLVGKAGAGAVRPAAASVDATFAAIVKMCRTMANAHFAPLAVTFRHSDNGRVDQYVGFFHAPVEFSARENALHFDVETLRRPLPAGNRELAYENDRVVERYLATLDTSRVQDKVREILLALLPAGDGSQASVAKALSRSVSTLQRQLKAEGTSFREVLEQTRYVLAQQLVLEQRHSLGQVAYLLGFSDQANFSRAFKRWTGKTPSAFRERAA